MVVFEIEELVTAEAHQVVVELEAWVETGDPAGMAGLCDNAHAREVFEGAVDGGACDAGEAILNGIEDLIGRWMVVEIEDRLENDPALHRAALAAFAAEVVEELDAFCSSRLVQAAAPRFPAILEDGSR